MKVKISEILSKFANSQENAPAVAIIAGTVGPVLLAACCALIYKNCHLNTNSKNSSELKSTPSLSSY